MNGLKKQISFILKAHTVGRTPNGYIWGTKVKNIFLTYVPQISSCVGTLGISLVDTIPLKIGQSLHFGRDNILFGILLNDESSGTNEKNCFCIDFSLMAPRFSALRGTCCPGRVGKRI